MPIRENKMRKKFKFGNSWKYDAHENIVSYSMLQLPPPEPPLLLHAPPSIFLHVAVEFTLICNFDLRSWILKVCLFNL